MSDTCKRCGKNDHPSNRCKATFRKSWVGQPAMVLKLRSANGSWIELTSSLDAKLFKRAQKLIKDTYLRAEPPAIPEQS